MLDRTTARLLLRTGITLRAIASRTEDPAVAAHVAAALAEIRAALTSADDVPPGYYRPYCHDEASA